MAEDCTDQESTE